MKWKSIILSPYGVTALIFLLAFLIAFSWEKALAATFLTAFSIYFLDVIRILYRSPKISLSRIDYYRFEDSIRIFTIVENKGKSVAKYVKPLLMIDDEKLIQLVYAEYSNFHKKWFSCSKDGSICTICSEDGREFLSPPPFEVKKEYLCWSVPEVDAGVGLNNKRYCHVTSIAPNDSQKIILGDIYRSEEEKACVIKIADEYGIEWKPRICYKVDLEKSIVIRFTLELVGEGFDPIKEKVELKITKDELKVTLKGSEKPITEFKDLRSFPARFIPPRVFR